jgi:hypothetical protein
MSDVNDNPYASPQAEVAEVKPLTAQGALTETMVFYLKGASPWVRFVAIVGFIMLGIGLLAGIFMLFGISSLPFLVGGGLMGGAAVAMGAVFFIFYLGMLILYFFPVLFAYRFGTGIKKFVFSGNSADLEYAFKSNKSLWKFIGILVIIMLGFFALMLVIMLIGAAFALAMR